MTLAFLVQY